MAQSEQLRQKVSFTRPVLFIAAQRDLGYGLVQIHVQRAPLTEATLVLSLSHEIFIFKTLVLEIEVSTKVLKRVESSLELQSEPEKRTCEFLYKSRVFNIVCT